jgi:carbon-monoxide dehydrogenase medium subunit
MMKMRMANIPHLIDLQDIPDLAQISLEGNRVVIGAMVTQAQLINDQTLASAAPLMKTMRYSQILNCHAYSVS